MRFNTVTALISNDISAELIGRQVYKCTTVQLIGNEKGCCEYLSNRIFMDSTRKLNMNYRHYLNHWIKLFFLFFKQELVH